jgi:processing peptidase subunit beta
MAVRALARSYTTADLSSHPQTQVTTLDNGMRVASEKQEGDTATVGVWVDTGSRYERADNNGVAHFLEHLFFKGTARRSRKQLEMEVENMGAQLNAYTSREQTVFYTKVFKEDVAQGLDILADMIQNSTITPQNVENERGVILREMEDVNSQIEEVVFDRLHETAYRENALGRTILGPVENIQRISQADIKEYIASHYTAPRMVIAGAGPIEHEELVDLAKKLFGDVPSSPTNGIEPYMEPARFVGSEIQIRKDEMEHAHVAYAFPTCGWTDPDSVPLMVMQSMLGTWDKNTAAGAGKNCSSKLVANLDKYGVATACMAFHTQYSDTGLFGVYTQSHPKGLEHTMYEVTQEVTRFCYEVDEEKLEAARNLVKTNILLQLGNTTTTCEEIGRHMLAYGRRIHPAEMLARIDSVDANAIKRAANRFFYDRDFARSSIGALFEIPDYNWTRSRTYWKRF